MKKEEIIKILIDDEKEAIDGYEKYKSVFSEEERKKIDEIINDEKRHIKILEDMSEKKRIFGD